MGWSKKIIERIDDDTVMLSVVFTWQLPKAFECAMWWGKFLGYRVSAGGPAVKLMPDYLAGVAKCNEVEVDALPWHNSEATFTSRGCIRRCPFCAVPKIEGELVELDNWPVRPIVCDNNLLACSKAHFDDVVDKLKPLKGIDFNQGLDARLLTKHHAERLAELDTSCLRLAFDNIGYESAFMRGFEKLRAADIPADHIRIYTLLGFKDSPEDALYRLQTIRKLGAWPNPMRYQPLDTLIYNSYIGKYWTEHGLKQYMRYWARSMFFERMGIPFEEYESTYTTRRHDGSSDVS